MARIAMACIALLGLLVVACGTSKDKVDDTAGTGEIAEVVAGEIDIPASELPEADVCIPDCVCPDGKQKWCGDDGCGGSCGSCAPGLICDVDPCGDTPPSCGMEGDCAGKECGPDGMGGSCGTCPCVGCEPDEVMCQNGLCVAEGPEVCCCCKELAQCFADNCDRETQLNCFEFYAACWGSDEVLNLPVCLMQQEPFPDCCAESGEERTYCFWKQLEECAPSFCDLWGGEGSCGELHACLVGCVDLELEEDEEICVGDCFNWSSTKALLLWDVFIACLDDNDYFDCSEDNLACYDLAWSQCIDPLNECLCDPECPAVLCEPVETCDGLDNDCDGLVDEGFADSDADWQANCVDEDDDNDGDPDTTDCEPLNAIVFNGAGEMCDCIDNDCDGKVDEGFMDSNGDGTADCCDPSDTDNDGDPDVTDCSPFDPWVYHGAPELCDGKDNDCNGEIDEGYGPDYNGNGIPDACEGDKDDDNDGVDDEMDNCPLLPNPMQENNDLDETGDVCDPDDDNDLIDDPQDNCPMTPNPDQMDTDGDGFGDVCDGGCWLDDYQDWDDDCDGCPDATDCVPFDPDMCVLLVEWCDGKDNNCNGEVDEVDAEGCTAYWVDDNDGDGFGGVEVCTCQPPPGAKGPPGDCCDADPDAKPYQTKYFTEPVAVCGGFDYNCDGVEEPQFKSSCVEPPCSSGWFQPTPACGEVGEWCLNCGGCGLCIGQTIQQVQKCR